ncbi:hypothetical protein EJ06DRAFT_303439 [Trichodelitschia bisporula]|uniref:Uncharacterized protein n=1 Tax=Trichodelitschia bisporula TaxID=703511 RepID=A0A6G1I7J5_9PEZI|nr:hypothetical protein EJ06DRAFT_303439 [Trichodelitschia bisporula]
MRYHRMANSVGTPSPVARTRPLRCTVCQAARPRNLQRLLHGTVRQPQSVQHAIATLHQPLSASLTLHRPPLALKSIPHNAQNPSLLQSQLILITAPRPCHLKCANAGPLSGRRAILISHRRRASHCPDSSSPLVDHSHPSTEPHGKGFINQPGL